MNVPYVAQLVIHDTSTMTYDQRQSISRWLKRLAEFVVKDDNISNHFRARYMK